MHGLTYAKKGIEFNKYTNIEIIVAGHFSALFVGIPLSIIMAISIRSHLSPLKRNFGLLVSPAKYKEIILRFLLPILILLVVMGYFIQHPIVIMCISMTLCIGFLLSKGVSDWQRT